MVGSVGKTREYGRANYREETIIEYKNIFFIL
jgi:hypothetical protein